MECCVPHTLNCLAIVDVNPSNFSYDEVSCLGLNIVYFVFVLVVKINFDLVDLVVARVVGVKVAVAVLQVPRGVVLVGRSHVTSVVMLVVGSVVVNVGHGQVANRVVTIRSRVGLKISTLRVGGCGGCGGQVVVVAVGC